MSSDANLRNLKAGCSRKPNQTEISIETYMVMEEVRKAACKLISSRLLT